MVAAKRWVIAKRHHEDLLTHLLKLRGVADTTAFLHPDFTRHRHDAGLLGDMDKAVAIIFEAVSKKQTIGIYGDYDCDGIPGSALLAQGLEAIGAKTVCYIPTRGEGYGVSKKGIDALAAHGAKVIITVDCGTTATEQIKYAHSLDISVIVTDHHEPQSDMPNAVLLNPKVGQSYPWRELCGTGVVYKLLEALSTQFPDTLTESWLKWHLDLVALATICDMVPLQDENRVLVTYGMQVLRQSRNIGLQALMSVSGLEAKSLMPGSVGYTLGPRINAVGRMEDEPMLGFELLTTTDHSRAGELAARLNGLNSERQELLSSALREADALVKEGGYDQLPAIALYNPSWSVGIIGLIASRLLERYHRPIFIFGGADTIKGSARSIDAFALPTVFEQLSDHCLTYGGHALAGGLSLKPDRFKQFSSDLQTIATKILGREIGQAELHVDAEIGLDQVNLELAQELALLEPYGIGNPRPLFAVRNVILEEVKTIGNGQKHLRGKAVQGNRDIPFVAFGQGERLDQYRTRVPMSVAGRLEQNHWNGRTTVELHVVDVQ